MSITTIDTGACGARPVGMSSVGETGEDVCSVRPLRINPSDEAGETVRKLRDKLEWYRRRRARRAGWTQQFVPTGLAPLDAVLPHGGVPCGAVTEILSDGPGIGAMSLVMRIAAQCSGEWACAEDLYDRAKSGSESEPRAAPLYAQRQGLARAVHGIESPTSQEVGHPLGRDRRSDDPRLGSPGGTTDISPWRKPWEEGGRTTEAPAGATEGCVAVTGVAPGGAHRSQDSVNDDRCIIVVDTFGDFYSPAAWQHGIAPDRLIVLRTTNVRDALWAMDQSLRCPAVAAVIAPFTQLDERESRRLQLAAESTGCIGLILRPAKHRGKSFAAVQMLVESVPRRELNASADSCEHSDDSYPCLITLLAVREGMPTEPVLVDLRHETGIGPVHPVPVDRSAAKTA